MTSPIGRAARITKPAPPAPEPPHPLLVPAAMIRADLYALENELSVSGVEHITADLASDLAERMHWFADALYDAARARLERSAADRRREADRQRKAEERAEMHREAARRSLVKKAISA